MSKKDKIHIVKEKLKSLSEKDFTGKIEVNFSNGYVVSITMIEKLKID